MDILNAFGFQYHLSVRDPTADLAHLQCSGVVHLVWTEDFRNAFLYGAVLLVHPPTINLQQDDLYSTVRVYEAKQSRNKLLASAVQVGYIPDLDTLHAYLNPSLSCLEVVWNDIQPSVHTIASLAVQLFGWDLPTLAAYFPNLMLSGLIMRIILYNSDNTIPISFFRDSNLAADIQQPFICGFLGARRREGSSITEYAVEANVSHLMALLASGFEDTPDYCPDYVGISPGYEGAPAHFLDEDIQIDFDDARATLWVPADAIEAGCPQLIAKWFREIHERKMWAESLSTSGCKKRKANDALQSESKRLKECM